MVALLDLHICMEDAGSGALQYQGLSDTQYPSRVDDLPYIQNQCRGLFPISECC